MTMEKIEVLKWDDFMKGRIAKKDSRVAEQETPLSFKLASSTFMVIFLPVAVGAEGLSGSTFSSIFDTVLTVADYACWGTIIYCGGTWMFGNRTKALEILLGTAIGYIIIRHAKDIQEWLAAI